MHLGSVELMGLQTNIFYLKTIWWNSLDSFMKWYLLFETCFSVFIEYLLFKKSIAFQIIFYLKSGLNHHPSIKQAKKPMVFEQFFTIHSSGASTCCRFPKRNKFSLKPWQILHILWWQRSKQDPHAASYACAQLRSPPSDGALSFCHDWYFSSRFEAEMLWMSWMMNSLLLSRSQSPTPRGSARAWAQGRHQHWRPNRRLPVQLVQWPFGAFWQCTLLEHFASLSAAVAARYECNHHDKAEYKDQHLG